MRMTWLKTLFPNRLPRSSKTSKRSTKRSLIRSKPRLEALEARYLLSTFGVQVFDNGTPVTGTTISTGPNSFEFIGSSANFSTTIVGATTNSPGTPSGAILELSPQSEVQATTPGPINLTIELTSTDYSLPTGSSIVVSSSAGGEYLGSGSVNASYQTYFDPNDDAFGMPAGSATPLETATASGSSALVYSPGTAIGTFARPNPLFSMTSVATFTINNASNGDVVNLGGTTVASESPMASPTLTTTPSPTNVTLGTSPVTLTDTADLEGGNNPTGTITFTLYNPSGTLVDTEYATVDGNGTYTTSTGYTLPTTGTVTGTYQWDASYSGDANNATASDSSAANEQVTVTPATPTITTSQQPASAVVGTAIADQATVTGYSPTGTVTFNLYSDSSASGTPLFTDTENLVNGVATSGSYTATATGTDYWVATYNGDSNNSLVTSSPTAEPVTITPYTPSIVTAQQPASAVVGTAIADQAIVTGYSPTGTVSFALYNNSSASGTPRFTDTENLVNGVATSASYTATATGTDYWVATYNGDSNNSSVSSSPTAEPVTITPYTPTINTTQSTTSTPVGTSISDTATVTGLVSPSSSDTVTFNLYSSATTQNSSTLLYSDTETVSLSSSTATATSANYTATTTGTDYWVATFNGDSNNSAVTSSAKAEPVTISTASPAITTTPGGSTSTGITISGTKYLDLTGNGFSSDDPGLGGVTIELFQGATPSGNPYETTTTAANGSYSFTGLAAGTYSVEEVVPSGYIQTGGGPNGTAGNTYYTITAQNGYSYSGYNFDDYEVPTCTPTNVCYTITTPSGCTTNVTSLDGNTQPGDKVTVTFTVPAGMNDTLTLVSYSAPGSSFSDSTAYEQEIYQQASGTFAPGTHTLTVQIPSCDYQIDFVCGQAINQLEPNQNNDAYGPDSANVLYHAEDRFIDSDSGGTQSPAASSMNSATPNTPTPTQTAVQAATLTDSATLSGGYNPTGTITFYLFAPGVTPALSNGVYTNAIYSDQVTVAGNGSCTTSPGYTLPANAAAGIYQWDAVYSGDANNAPVSDIGNLNEQVTVPPSGNVTISGYKYLDLTGNGFSCDDTGLGGVTIELFKGATPNGTAYETTTTAANGSYSFTGLAAGTYSVEEVVPSGYIQTGGGPNGTAGNTYYTITASSNGDYTGNNFDDYKIPTCQPTCVSYCVSGNCKPTTVSDLRGNTQQGDMVTVTFTVAAGMSDQLTLVSYIAPGSSFDSSTAYEQQIYDEATGTFGPGTHTLSVLLPNCYYQVDFVCGAAINELGNPNAGPDSANIFYSAQDRLISADNGGTQVCTQKQSCSNGDYSSTSFWCGSYGQTLINCLNGNSQSTNLAYWLATTFPNLYGAGAGSHCLINSNGTYFTNAQVAQAFANCFSGADQQVLATALSMYATSSDLAGSSAASVAQRYGLNTSSCGSGGDTCNVGSSGAAFGLANNSVETIFSLLEDLNCAAVNGVMCGGNQNLINLVDQVFLSLCQNNSSGGSSSGGWGGSGW